VNRTESSKRVVIRVVAEPYKNVKNVPGEILGLSVADHHGGAYAFVFLNPAEDRAGELNLPRIMVLAYAAAHEVGHLLLGDQAHTPQGLMKASWDTQDFRAMAQGSLHFSPQQTRELTNRYGTAHRAEVGADKELAVRH
jgi:hypothetical protein